MTDRDALREALTHIRDADAPISSWDGWREVQRLRDIAAAALATPPPAEALAYASDEQIAQRFHAAYERLAPTFGYETRRESAVPWSDVPSSNRRLMTAVAGEVRAALTASLAEPPPEDEEAVE